MRAKCEYSTAINNEQNLHVFKVDEQSLNSGSISIKKYSVEEEEEQDRRKERKNNKHRFVLIHIHNIFTHTVADPHRTVSKTHFARITWRCTKFDQPLG